MHPAARCRRHILHVGKLYKIQWYIKLCGNVQVKSARVPVVGVMKLGERPNVQNHTGGEVRWVVNSRVQRGR